MQIATLNSSVIRQVRYDANRKILEMTLIDHRRYRYFYVPEPIFMGLMATNSPGRFYNNRIKGQFPVESLG